MLVVAVPLILVQLKAQLEAALKENEQLNSQVAQQALDADRRLREAVAQTSDAKDKEMVRALENQRRNDEGRYNERVKQHRLLPSSAHKNPLGTSLGRPKVCSCWRA